MKLNYRKTIYVGFAFFLISTFWQAYDTIIPKILTDKFGMLQSWSGVIMALDNVLALFMLPLFGAISDKTKSKRGRRTPFIAIGTFVACALFVVLSVTDYKQLSNIADVAPGEPGALEILYDADVTVKTPLGEQVLIRNEFSRNDFTTLEIDTTDYTNYVIPARQAYARMVTERNRGPLILFVVVLFLVLFTMSTFRSPAVALMPDVTMKPLRSKANSIINLMGAAGGITVLILGMLFGTGKAENALMSYIPFFSVIALIMLASLAIFLWKVKEPELVREMHEESKKHGLMEADEDGTGVAGKLARPELISLILILSSVVLWFMGYNAVISKYSVYAGKVLNLDYNLTLTIASAAAIVSYLPIGIVASKIGRKKTILGGIVILGTAFLIASFMREGSPMLLMNTLFALAGVGWATINVNSYPMVVELSKSGDVGKYTGFYYTASMAAQTITPILSGVFLDIRFTTLFPYAALFVFTAFLTMLFVKHGDNKPDNQNTALEHFNIED